ncbi:MAG: hypothetical protein HZA50_05600, partial [Planctomycetes bacterium]|nr:hypothetical protein [Planctomycetota bacterium]
QLREKSAQTEALIRQLEEKAQREAVRRPPPVREPIQLRQDRPAPVVIRFNHISAGSFVKTLDQLARNPKVAEALKEMPWALNEEANAVVMILPPEAAEMLTNMARELDQPSQYHKAAPRHDLKFNLPVPPGVSGPIHRPGAEAAPGRPGAHVMPGQPGARVMPGQPGGWPIPGTGITIPSPMQPGASCPMQGMKNMPGAMPGACPMQGGQCPMQGMKDMPGGQCPMQGMMKAMQGGQCPMQGMMKAMQGGQCPMQGMMKAMQGSGQCPMQGMKDMPGGQCPMQGMKGMSGGGQTGEIKVIIDGVEVNPETFMRPLPGPMPMQPGPHAMPGAAAPGPMRPAAQERIAPKIAEAMELLESVLRNQPNPRIAELVKALQAAMKEQAGQKQIMIKEEIERDQKRHDADKEKTQDRGRFRIMLKDDDDDDDKD